MSDMTLESELRKMIESGRMTPEAAEAFRNKSNKGRLTDFADNMLAGSGLPDMVPSMLPPSAIPAPSPAPPSEPWPASTATRLSEPWSLGEQADRPADSGGIEAYSQDLSKQRSRMQSGVDAQTTSMIDAKATVRARNAMEKRRLREEMTGEPQPGLGYEETLTQERIKVERQFEEDRQKRKGAAAAGGMSTIDVLLGKAPPKVGGEFVFPPGDMRNSPAYQKAKAEADEAQIVREIPDDEQLGGTNPEDTEPVKGPDEGGSLPTDDVQGPGDLRRLSAQRKLDQLHNLRSIAEGGMRMGNIPVQGDFSGTGPPRPFVTGQPQKAEGIRAEIARVTGDESLYLKSQLKREEQTSLFQDRAQEERLKARLENLGVGPNNLTMRQSDALWKDREVWIKGATYVKANEALAAVRAGLESLKDIDDEAPPGQAQMLAARQLLKAYGEGSRMSDYDLKSIIYSPQFAGMYDRAYLFIFGKTTPATVKLYKEMLTKLDKATKEHFNNVRQKRAESFKDHWGVPVDVVLKTYGSLFGEEGMPKAAPKGTQILVFRDGEKKWVMEVDEEKHRIKGWTRGA